MSLFEKFLKYLKAGQERHAQRLVMEEKMKEFLNNSANSCQKLTHISDQIDNLQTSVHAIDEKVNGLERQVNTIKQKQEIIGAGTKTELFETLYHWKQILTQRGWKTAAEMREIEEIYKVYHDGLGGNGQGEHYYNEIKDLPEREI